MEKFKYSPGLPGYGTRGADGSSGQQGLGMYFSDFNGSIDTGDLTTRINNNQSLISSSSDPLPGGREYVTGDLFVDAASRIYYINLSLSTPFEDTGQILNSSTLFVQKDKTTSDTPREFTRYTNNDENGAAINLIDIVFSSSEKSTYGNNPGSGTTIYGVEGLDFAQIKFADIVPTGSNFIPFTLFSNDVNSANPENTMAIVKEDTDNTWHIGNTESDGTTVRAVNLVLDFQEISTSGNITVNNLDVNGTLNTSGVIDFDSLHLTGWLRVDSDASFNSNFYVASNTYISGDASIKGTLRSGNFYGNTGIFTGNVDSDGDGVFSGNVSGQNASFTNNIKSSGGNLTIAGDSSLHDLWVDNELTFVNSTNNFIQNRILGGDLTLRTLDQNDSSISSRNGRNIYVISGKGSDNTNTSGGNAGHAGDILLSLGNGGDAGEGGGNGTGGDGGSFIVNAGDGGNSGILGSGGDGGDIILNAGRAGVNISGSSFPGPPGDVSINTGAQSSENGGNLYLHAKDGGKIYLTTEDDTGDIILEPKHSSGETIIYKARFSGTADFDDDIDVEGQILAADGTESLPSISFTNDTDTGLFSDGTLFLISVGGASRTSINSSGDIVTEGNVTAYGSVGSSDKRLKENIKPLSNSLDKVLSLRGVNFDYIGKNTNQNGYIAQEVEKVMPEVVSEFESVKDKKMYKGIKYETIIPYLSESIKELKGIIDSQNKRIEELEKQLKG